MDENRKHEEVERSQSILTQLIGMPVSGFSFPYGSKSSAQGMASILERAGYKFAFTMERAINTHLNQPFALARIDNNDAPGGKHFKAKEESFMTAMSHRSWHLHATSQA
jgi:peptidoglycan/xylan/chitin deacetylase (PgdA/CDA1 family)